MDYDLVVTNSELTLSLHLLSKRDTNCRLQLPGRKVDLW